MAQVDYGNALGAVRIVTAKAMNCGDDIVLQMRHEGTFTEVYELADFPCDQQALALKLNFNVRDSGPVPINLVISPGCTCSMDCIDLCPPAKQWHVEPDLRIVAHHFGPPDRRFPALTFVVIVTRQPFFYLMYLAVPMGVFSLLGVMQQYVDSSTVSGGNHRAQLSLMLVLTAATYRMAISAKLPPVSYMTMLDTYTLWQALIIILGAMLSRLITIGHVDESGSGRALSDTACTAGITLLWLYTNVSFALLVRDRLQNPQIHDEFLNKNRDTFIAHDPTLVSATPLPRKYSTKAHKVLGLQGGTGGGQLV